MTAAKLWPLAIVGVLVVTVAGNALLFYEARDRDAASVEPDYYRKALAWDSTMAEAARSAALGWRVEATLGAPEPGGAVLVVRLTDARGLPVEGAAIGVEAVHNLDPSRPVRATLLPAREGTYRARLPLAHRGLWELRLTAARGAERFVTRVRRDAGGGPP